MGRNGMMHVCLIFQSHLYFGSCSVALVLYVYHFIYFQRYDILYSLTSDTSAFTTI